MASCSMLSNVLRITLHYFSFAFYGRQMKKKYYYLFFFIKRTFLSKQIIYDLVLRTRPKVIYIYIAIVMYCYIST